MTWYAWRIVYTPSRPKADQWRAMLAGVTLYASTRAQVCRMVSDYVRTSGGMPPGSR